MPASVDAATPVPDVLVHAVKASASLAACYLFASLYPDIKRVRELRATGAMPLLPLTSMFGNCVLWTIYGFLARDFFPLVATNAVGIGFSVFYIAVYFQYTPERRAVQRQLVATASALFLLSLYPVFSYEPRHVVQQRIGYVAIAVCAVMFGSPLVLVREVIRSKSTGALPFGMILAGVINSLLWLTYGLIVSDVFVVAPNSVNLVLGGIQLFLFCLYPSPKPYSKLSTADAKVHEAAASASVA
ncbi:hypothetical protein P43SY_008523 [Pythium insidiosum]|uniref:Sugar transporter SWEET1 n=1 Tax=Pythium insidiosum TaxID=114742 RepID=A0AAD5LU87_PYTIN|nr:hypothetical protein P43SY_008523 [Pythium insidiosum]